MGENFNRFLWGNRTLSQLAENFLISVIDQGRTPARDQGILDQDVQLRLQASPVPPFPITGPDQVFFMAVDEPCQLWNTRPLGRYRTQDRG